MPTRNPMCFMKRVSKFPRAALAKRLAEETLARIDRWGPNRFSSLGGYLAAGPALVRRLASRQRRIRRAPWLLAPLSPHVPDGIPNGAARIRLGARYQRRARRRP